jgi:hypothetical protein
MLSRNLRIEIGYADSSFVRVVNLQTFIRRGGQTFKLSNLLSPITLINFFFPLPLLIFGKTTVTWKLPFPAGASWPESEPH